MPRRYRIGKHPKYDKIFDHRKLQSPILSPEKFAHSSVTFSMGNKAGLEGLVEEWSDKLLKAVERCTEIDHQFERTKQKAVNEGRKPPEDMPKDMMEELHRRQARWDVAAEEYNLLKRQLADFTEREKRGADEAVLRRGPRGIGKIKNGVLCEVDGQNVSQDAKGVLFIDDPRSPYDGMTAVDYTETVVKPWKRAQAKAQRLEYEAAHAEGREAKKIHVPWPGRPDDVRAKKKTRKAKASR